MHRAPRRQASESGGGGGGGGGATAKRGYNRVMRSAVTIVHGDGGDGGDGSARAFRRLSRLQTSSDDGERERVHARETHVSARARILVYRSSPPY